MAKSVQLGNGRNWVTQTEAKHHFKQMLSRYSNGERVLNKDDHSDLLALLEIYDREIQSIGKTKIGCGVELFLRDRDADHPGNTACFFIHRIDGTKVDFSYLRAVESASRKKLLTHPY